MKHNNRITQRIHGVAAAAIIVFLSLAFSGCAGGAKKNTEPWLKDYAAELIDKGLYKEAVDAYKDFLRTPDLDPKIRANVYYMLGDVYREQLFDYKSAMASYMKVKYIDPDTELGDKIDKKIIECLEKMGRSTDAKRELDRIISNKPHDTGDENIVAQVGGRKITGKELDGMISRSYMDPDKMTVREKAQFLQSRIANELMANAAERKGYGKDQDTLLRLEDFRRTLLAQKIFKEEIGAKVSVDPEKVRLYYEANKDDFKDEDGNPKRFEDVRREIYSKLYMQQQQEAAQDYIQRLLKAESVDIYMENIKGAPEHATGAGASVGEPPPGLDQHSLPPGGSD